MGARNDDDGLDARIAALADAQHGVVTRRQLLEERWTTRQVAGRVDRRHLLPLFRGVYAVGHAKLRREGHLLAAAWSAGAQGTLFDVTAANVHGVRPSSAALVDVVLPQRTIWTPQPGIRAHVSSTLRPEDLTVVDGLPVTTLARTVVDLAARHPPRVVELVLNEMDALGLYDQTALEAQTGRLYVRGTRQLTEILGARVAGSTVTRSELEELLIAVCDAHDLPRPWCNDRVLGYEVDAHWRGTGVLAELDSARFHADRAAFEADRAKGNALVAGGHVLLRFTWRQLSEEPARVAQTLRDVLFPTEPVH